MKDFGPFQTSLRVDAINSKSMAGSARNIARLNTNAVAAYNSARFGQLAKRLLRDDDDDTKELHVFATFAYQTIPARTYFMTISSVTLDKDTETWSND